ncbi:MAG TPA: hypothetical protein PLI51_02585 [bacterium]|nr:hypothetical protein [bacterium]HPQ65603.1 hypothetical protein [bacterium]
MTENASRTVLFVCTGNIFRSMSAELAFNSWNRGSPLWRAASAGIVALPQAVRPAIRERLLSHGLDPGGHRQRRLDREMLGEADLVVAMGTDHRRYLDAAYGYSAPLFNQVAYGAPRHLPDVEEAVPGWEADPAGVDRYVGKVVDHIVAAIPAFTRNLGGYLPTPAEASRLSGRTRPGILGEEGEATKFRGRDGNRQGGER